MRVAREIETISTRWRGKPPLYRFDFQPVREHPPLASKQAARQAKDIKTIGRCRAPHRFPLKFANTRVKCEFIRRSVTARLLFTAQTRFNAVSRLRQPRNGKTGFPSPRERRGERLRAARGISIAPSLKYKHNSIGPYSRLLRLQPPISNTNPFLHSVQRSTLFSTLLRPLFLSLTPMPGRTFNPYSLSLPK